jgi:hypothetical protein
MIQAEIASGEQSGRIGYVGDDDGDLDTRQAPFADRSVDGQEVRSAAGEQYAEAKRVGLGRWSQRFSFRESASRRDKAG